MNKKYIFGLFLILLLFSACTKTEIIEELNDESSSSINEETNLVPEKEVEDEKIYCTDEDKSNYGCYMDYDPVCAYFDSSVTCGNPPCSVTESDPCKACLRYAVDYYIKGEC
jgi:hypothetical protein